VKAERVRQSYYNQIHTVDTVLLKDEIKKSEVKADVFFKKQCGKKRSKLLGTSEVPFK
jgi:hypothetical protein